MKYIHFLYPAVILLLFSCGEEDTDSFIKEKTDRKISFNLVQRHDTLVRFPGGELGIAIGNVTGKQTHITLRKNGLTIFEKSIREKESVVFAMGQHNFGITCENLENFLIGNDFATFSIAEITRVLSPGNRLQLEQEKIRAMLDLISTSEITFIRNGKQYTALEAFNHLKIKYKRAKSNIKTLDGFIREVGSRSILTDKPYYVKLKDKRTLLMERWLGELKKELD